MPSGHRRSHHYMNRSFSSQGTRSFRIVIRKFRSTELELRSFNSEFELFLPGHKQFLAKKEAMSTDHKKTFVQGVVAVIKDAKRAVPAAWPILFLNFF